MSSLRVREVLVGLVSLIAVYMLFDYLQRQELPKMPPAIIGSAIARP